MRIGTTSTGSNHNCIQDGCGSVFKLSPAGKETMLHRVLHSFNYAIDGNAVISPLILDSAGNFYGTADEGGFYGFGTVFEITP